MPRANRLFLPGFVWHITHRCHRRQFLLKFVRDRRNYLRWLLEARKRFGLCVLDYMVTSNHIHLLVQDTGNDVIARSMQLAAGRTAQQYNRRKSRQGAFWEDRYHATAIETDTHLHRCVVYMDLNMVRAGIAKHANAWENSGYNEIQNPRKRYRLIDLDALSTLCGFGSVGQLQRAHDEWVEQALSENALAKDARWSESVAVGSERFTEEVKRELGLRAKHRQVVPEEGGHSLREPLPPYGDDFDLENAPLSFSNTVSWHTNPDATET
jgi:putative transposase